MFNRGLETIPGNGPVQSSSVLDTSRIFWKPIRRLESGAVPLRRWFMIPSFFACVLHPASGLTTTVVIHYGIRFLSSSHAHASVQGLYLVATAKIVKLLLATKTSPLMQLAVAAILGTGPDAVVAVLDFIPISLVGTGVYWRTFISSLCSSRGHHVYKPNVD